MIISFSTIMALLSLTTLEVILGVDNILFISILVSKLPPDQQDKARFLGLLCAMFTRILLLFSLVWMSHLTKPLWLWGEHVVSGRALVLFFGGVFLVFKSTQEIYEMLESVKSKPSSAVVRASRFWSVILQISIIDIVFSIDSVLTAIGMANEIWIMVASIILAVVIMLFIAKSIDALMKRHPSVKILALSFLMLVGAALILDAFEYIIPRSYLYCIMFFSFFVEVLNIQLRRKNIN